MYYCGIDLGGTKVYSIIIDHYGNIIGSHKVKTKYKSDFNKIFKRIILCYNELIEKLNITEKEIKAIGLGVPSSVKIKTGVLIHAPNLDIKNINIAEKLIKQFNKPVYVDNDGNLGLYGEHYYGKAKSYKSIYGIFVGTGIGGAYLYNNEIIRGKNYTAGEIGHVIVEINGPKCGCGRKGCFEAIAGKVGIINYMKKLIKKNKINTSLDKYEPDWKNNIGSSILSELYHKNDEAVVKALNRSGKVIGIVCANIINLIGVDAILLGGGLMNDMAKDLLPVIKKFMIKYSIGDGAKNVKLLLSELKDNAVAYGAAKFISVNENNKYLIY
ncbi:MAG: ROK family protein [Spirochaetes bacterium]|nr:ROK family protein [Spirochaetota bacterium]